MTVKPPLLLTGAGFTKNFGGFLAAEMFALIQTSVRGNRLLLKMLKASLDYEQVYGSVVIEQTAGGDEERSALQAAVEDAYTRLDDAVRRLIWTNDRVGVSPYRLHEFIGKFAGRSRDERGYFFTLNQDLFIERHYGIAAGDALLHLHGQLREPDGLHQNPGRELNGDDYRTLDNDVGKYREADRTSRNTFHYVKLHGSLNWRSSRTENAMVIGHGKEELISKEPLLAYYLETFEHELYQPERRLCVLGYGFRDRHINKRIATALERYNLQLFVISPESSSQFRDSLRGPEGVPRGHLLWERAVHWPWTLAEIFPAGLSRREHSSWSKVIEETLFN